MQINVPMLSPDVGDLRTGTVKSVLLAILKIVDLQIWKWRKSWRVGEAQASWSYPYRTGAEVQP